MAEFVRMESAPCEAWEPQVGWIYRVIKSNPISAQLRAVELRDGTPIEEVNLDLTMPGGDFARHFKEADRG